MVGMSFYALSVGHFFFCFVCQRCARELIVTLVVSFVLTKRSEKKFETKIAVDEKVDK